MIECTGLAEASTVVSKRKPLCFAVLPPSLKEGGERSMYRDNRRTHESGAEDTWRRIGVRASSRKVDVDWSTLHANGRGGRNGRRGERRPSASHRKKKKKKKKKKYIAGSSRSMMIDGSVDVGVPHPDSRDWQQVEGKGRGEAIRHISGNNSNQATFDLMPAERKRQEDNFPVKGED